MANPFDVLGVARGASEAEIKAAFKQKAKQHHPDANLNDPNATAKFAEVSAAYDELKDGKAATWADPTASPFGHAGGFHDPFGGMNGVQQCVAQPGRSSGPVPGAESAPPQQER